MNNEQIKDFVQKNIVCVVSVVVSIALAVVIYLRIDVEPAAEKIAEAKSAESTRLSLNRDNSIQLSDQLAALADLNRSIESRLIHAGQLAENLQYFYRIESDTHTHLVDLREGSSLRTKKDTGLYIPVQFNVTVEGDYRSLLEFMRRIENGPHYARIDGCNMKSSTSSESGPRSTATTMSLEVQLLGEP